MKTEYTELANYKVISFDKIPSTQTYAYDMIAAGRGADHIAILADAQSAGRGRYQRKWISHHGNLYVSFIFSCEERDARLAYAVGVAIAETLIAFGVPATIKWPNDILVDGKKISGTLIEYAGHFVVVGIGINIKSNPTVNATYKTTKMDNFVSVTRDEVLNKLMRNLDKWRNTDFMTVRARWTELAAGLLNRSAKYRGEKVEVIGINENGALILRRQSQYFLVYGDEITLE